MRDMNQVLLNPVRSRIVQYVARHQKVTAGELATWISDVPRTTLYRHLKILMESNIIIVVAENRVRGSVERTYSLNLKAWSEENTVENATRNIFGFLMKIFADFDSYFSDKDADPGADKLFVNNVTLLLSDAEYNEVLGDIAALLTKHIENQPNENRRQRNISIISSPCKEGGISNEN